MAYTALYRKLRPKTFDDLIGQPHIVTTLKNQVLAGRVSHAYLFCGTRGTGKTSAAKIFARAVNCENPSNGSPCNVCPVCEGILRGRNLNVVEIDAASNNGVDNIRDIREEVKYPPTEGKYRIYIIDETHMLSAGAFNALLKTLEEPPDYTIFILATTDPQRIPATVLSRVQRFDFRRISQNDMANALKNYMATEGLKIDDDTLAYVAGVSDGSMRDALSVLDQCASFYYGETLTLEKALDVIGAAGNGAFFRLTDALAAYDGGACLEIIDEISMLGRDITLFAADAAVHFRNLLVAQSVKDASAALPYSKETVAMFREQAERVGGETLFSYVSEFSKLQGELRYAANPRALLEIACLKICHPSSLQSAGFGSVLARIGKIETDIEKGVSLRSKADTDGKKTVKAENGVEAKNKTKIVKKAVPEDIKNVIAGWPDITRKLAMPFRQYLDSCSPAYLEGDALVIVAESQSLAELARQNEQQLKEALASEFGRDFFVRFTTRGEYDDRHKSVYGAPDAAFSDKDYTDVLGDGIIFD